MKIYEYVGLPSYYGAMFKKGHWYKDTEHRGLKTSLYMEDFREIDPDPTVAHTIELESCNAVITADSCYFRDAPAPILTLEEMQRVTRCMEMLREAKFG